MVVSQPERPVGGDDEHVVEFVNALRREFGPSALAVAQRQFAEAGGDARVTWRRIVAMLSVPDPR